MSIGLEITKDTATKALEGIPAKVSPQRMSASVGPALTRLLQDNFRSLGPNKRGYPSTGFWADAARSTSWAQAANGTVVSVNKIGVRLRYFGTDGLPEGAIVPINAKALAIPIDAESYGRLPSEFPGLFLVKTKKGAYLCVKEGASRTGPKGAVKGSLKGSLKFLFKLVYSVKQKADPDVLPARDEMLATTKEAMVAAMKN